MDKTEIKVTRKDLLQFLVGHKKANELIKAERRKRLSQLTTEDSLREYETLCNTRESSPDKEGLKFLERRKIEFLLKRRELLNMAGQYKTK